ncbi:S26 family signal peptidase [Jatrophihabitans fulvus]
MADRQLRRPRPLILVAVAASGVLVVLAAGWYALGGRGFVVRTPSMGSYAPVGTFVATRPVAFDEIRTGDVIAFHPPTTPDETYTHRVVAVTPAGLKTRGDINGATDPWTVTSKDLVGRAAVVLPGVGWLVRALPYLIGGGLLVWALTRSFVSAGRRGPARQFGLAVVFLLTALMLKPFVGVAQLSAVSDPDGVSRIHVVSTGLLPVRLEPSEGTGKAAPVDLDHAGAAGVSVLRDGEPGKQYHLQASLHLSPLQWVAAIGVALSPLLWTLLIGFAPPAPKRGTSHRASHAAGARREPVPA